MKELKYLSKGKYALRHIWHEDGFPLSEIMEIIKTNQDGTKIHFPFLVPLKVKSYNKNSHIFQPTKYTEEEYQTILDEANKLN